MKQAMGGNKAVSVTPQTSFDRCLVDGDAAAMSNGRELRRKAFGISFAIETAALAALIIAPLVTSVAKPIFYKSTVLSDLFTVPHKPITGVRHANPTSPSGGHYANFFSFPVGHPAPRPAENPEGREPQSISSGELGFGQADPNALGIDGIGFKNPIAPPLVEIKRTEEKHRMKVNEGVEQAQLILRVEPRYPPLAMQVKIEGTVILQAIIGSDGRITALQVVSGHPLLVSAALDAVRQWRYRPTLLNGEPVEVETTITVIFRLRP